MVSRFTNDTGNPTSTGDATNPLNVELVSADEEVSALSQNVTHGSVDSWGLAPDGGDGSGLTDNDNGGDPLNDTGDDAPDAEVIPVAPEILDQNKDRAGSLADAGDDALDTVDIEAMPVAPESCPRTKNWADTQAIHIEPAPESTLDWVADWDALKPPTRGRTASMNMLQGTNCRLWDCGCHLEKRGLKALDDYKDLYEAKASLELRMNMEGKTEESWVSYGKETHESLEDTAKANAELQRSTCRLWGCGWHLGDPCWKTSTVIIAMYSNQAGGNTRYKPQATDEASWDNSEKFPSNKKRTFYRPTALRWYFVIGQIAFLMAVVGLVTWALIEMPNSDGTAKIIHKRSRNDSPNFPRDDAPMTPEVMRPTRLSTTYIVSDVSTVVTVPGTTGKYTTKISTTEYSTHWDITTTVKDGVTVTSADYTVIPTKVVTEVVTTRPGEATKSVFTSISVGYSVVYPSGSDSAAPGTVSYTQAITVTQAYSLPGAVTTYTSTLEGDRTETIYTTIVEDGETKTISHVVTEEAPTVYESVGETTASASTYVSYGKITITSIFTDQKPMAKPKPTAKAKPTVIDVVTVDPDHTVKKVEKLDPTTYVTKVKGVETVEVVVSKEGETLVSEIGAVETTIDVVETGVDGLLTTNQVVSTKPASLATIVKSAAPTTIISTKSINKLKTITSDRTDSSTIISTVKGKTRTYEKTTTLAPTATDDASEAGETGGVVKTVVTVYELDAGKYFLGKFLPPILAVMLSIPARVIDYNAQLFQPFHALNRVDGATGPESMNLHFDGWSGLMEPFNGLVDGHPVPFITMLIVLFSALLTPLAVEAVGFKMHGQCKINAYEGCAPALGVSPLSSRILLAVLGLMILLLCALLFFLRKFHTGVYANPWSVAGIASLASNRDIRPQQDSERRIEKEMAEKRYGFGFFENRAGETEYGIVLYDDAGENLQHDRALSESSSMDTQVASTGRRNPFIVLGLAWRLVFLLFLLGLMVFLLYYHLTLDKASAFKNFMNSQTFGVRFLFAAFGVIISFSWTAFFITIAMVVPYQVMSHGPQSASNSVLLTRPTNPFSGLWSAIKHRQIFLGLVALLGIFSEFLPILLANIPYSLSQVRISHDICARISVGILALMAVAIIISFIIRWPDMPVDPRSIAGAMYYVSESNMVDHFSGMADMDGEERKQRIGELGGTYLYGELTTRTGEKRPAVEWDDHTLGVDPLVSRRRKDNIQVRHESIDTAYHGHQS
ncbi:hypothetical protein F53441_2776 [Fusarium austroafricanum]|uniref:Zonadhesin n=1 Tax=Fusarium austroafricanum TaxID=2364996 RepID=A0A8H4P2G9_9HYPO|nr:hypothetical protein F53441_2776 [Fusarium austroafricanum]